MKAIKKGIMPLITGIWFVLCLNVQAAQIDEPKSAFIILNDDSGVLTEPEQAAKLKLLMLAQLKALKRKRQYAKAKLVVISTAYAKSIFVGDIADLSGERATELLDKIAANESRCNQLIESFDSVEQSIFQLKQQGYNDIHLYVFSSLIGTKNPCDGVQEVTLPQLPVPVDFKIKLTNNDVVQTIVFYYANSHQVRLYQDALKGVSSWGYGVGKAFAIFDMEGTMHELRHGLAGVQ